MGTSNAVASLFSVLTEGEVKPRSIILNALAERPLRRASARIEIFRSSRNIRSLRPTSIDSLSFPNGSICPSTATSPEFLFLENSRMNHSIYAVHYTHSMIS